VQLRALLTLHALRDWPKPRTWQWDPTNGFVRILVNNWLRDDRAFVVHVWDHRLLLKRTLAEASKPMFASHYLPMVHEHPYAFSSTLVSGDLYHMEYEVEACKQGAWQRWCRYGLSTRPRRLERSNMFARRHRRLVQGTQYSFPARRYHMVIPAAATPTVTFVEQLAPRNMVHRQMFMVPSGTRLKLDTEGLVNEMSAWEQTFIEDERLFKHPALVDARASVRSLVERDPFWNKERV
jgi:hypothetical protein